MSALHLPDANDRERAWGSEKSVVVEASAGTGKTFLLVQRALWHIFVKKRELSRLVALAFGEKAAREMAKRLRDVLDAVATAPSLEKLPQELALMNHGESLATLQKLARKAIAGFQRARISTIHSFAADILRLFPAEAGVDPSFEVDRGRAFGAIVEKEWDIFLAEQLGRFSPNPAMWRDLLGKVQLAHVGELAAELAGFRVDLPGVLKSRQDRGVLLEDIRPWLTMLHQDSQSLREGYPLWKGGKTKAEYFLEAMEQALETLLAGKEVPEVLVEPLSENISWSTKLGTADLVKAERLERAARYLRHVRNEETVYQVTEALVPFAERVRKTLLESGKIPYEGLLSLARDLLRENREVREAMKRRFDGVLVDEAQDVDPLQLEIILYISELEGASAGRWEDVRLHPGKLFLVGDPKQSIYGFRNADLAAFNEVLDRAKKEGAESVVLTTSMRSDGKLLGFINEVGPQIIPDSGGVSGVRYSPLLVNPLRKGELPEPRTAYCEVEIGRDEKKWKKEAEAAASWIKQLIQKENVKPGEIAVLFRTHSWISRYAEALMQAGVPVTIEGESDFYTRQETTDLMNVVFLLADQSDDIALAGVLRGPFGALDDPALHKWFMEWLTDASRNRRRRELTPGNWRHDQAAAFNEMKRISGIAGMPAHLPALFTNLARLAAETGLISWRAWIERIWSELGVDELADRGGRIGAGEAVTVMRRLLAGLLEERGLAEAMETLRSCREAEQANEAVEVAPPVPPVPQNRNRVRLMTIHQAKGLEFKVVVLGGVGAKSRNDRATDTGFMEDWAHNRRGAAITAKLSRVALSTLAGAIIRLGRKERSDEEAGRLLYVALTRAKDLLLVMKPMNEIKGGWSVPPYISGIADRLSGTSLVARGESAPPFRAVARKPEAVSVSGNGQEYPGVEAEPELVSPSSLAKAGRDSALDDRWAGRPGSQSFDLILGEVCHRVLELWKYGSSPEGLGEAVGKAVDTIDPPKVMRSLLIERAGDLLKNFLASSAAQELGRARILGKEVPILAESGGRAVNARADVIYELDGRLFVGDYKTGSDPRVIPAVARAYAESASAALGAEVSFRIISLSLGRII